MITLQKTVLAAGTALSLIAVPSAAFAWCSGGYAQTTIAEQLEEAVSTHGADTISVGDLHLFNRHALETPPNARSAGGFLSIHNYSSEPNRLVSASSPVSERVELHTMTMEDDIMRMRELEDGIELPGETQVDLERGGLHIMFIGLEDPFVEGDEIPVTLTFASGESREIMLPVRARTMDHGSMDHGNGHGHDHGNHN